MRDSVAESVYIVLAKAARKFASRRWAVHQALVLEASIHAPEHLVTGVVAGLDPDELGGIDLTLLVDGDKIACCDAAANGAGPEVLP